MSGFSIVLGMPEGDAGGGEDKAAAKAALKAFRDSKDMDVALEAFMTLCRYAESAMDGSSSKDKGTDSGGY